MILFMRPEHVTRTRTNGNAVLLSISLSVSRDQYTALSLEGVLITWFVRIPYKFTFWYYFDTVLCQYLETEIWDSCLIGIVQRLRFSGFTLYTLSFFLSSPFKENVRVISSDPPYRDGIACITMVPLKPLFDQLCGRHFLVKKVLNSDNSKMF